MISYKDRTFCGNDPCSCPPERKLTLEYEAKAKAMGLPISIGSLCRPRFTLREDKMKKHIVPEGYDQVVSGHIRVGDLVWNRLDEMYLEMTQECALPVQYCVSVIRPKVSDQVKITKALDDLALVLKGVTIRKASSHLTIVGPSDKVIGSVEFHPGGKLKKVS